MKIHRNFLLLTIFILLAVGLAQPGEQYFAYTPPPKITPSSPDETDIVGGTVASPGEYPWMAALVISTEPDPNYGQYCGGSLVDELWVLTAAHCVSDESGTTPASEIHIVLGVNNLDEGLTAGNQGQRIPVTEVIVHPDYDPATEDSDLALLKLIKPASITTTVTTIAPASLAQSNLYAAGITATVTGWGDTSFGGSPTNELLEVDVPIVSQLTCNAAYAGEITANMLCAGVAGKDACQGDSGGPLIVPNGTGGWIQAGIVSWGEECGLPNFPGVYTRVGNFYSWIQSQTNGPENTNYLPLILNNYPNVPVNCTPDPPGESNNINDALIICSGQVVTGQVSNDGNDNGDLDDVYKIQVTDGQHLQITLSGSPDADIFLLPPTATDVELGPWPGISQNPSTYDELIEYTVESTGFWYVDVYGYTGIANYTLIVTITNP